MAAGPLGALRDAPIVLSDGPTLNAATAAFLKGRQALYAVGGAAVSAVTTLDNHGKTVNRLAGDDRFATAASHRQGTGRPRPARQAPQFQPGPDRGGDIRRDLCHQPVGGGPGRCAGARHRTLNPQRHRSRAWPRCRRGLRSPEVPATTYDKGTDAGAQHVFASVVRTVVCLRGNGRSVVAVGGSDGDVAPWPALFVPEERLGWSFADRDRLRRAFPEPRPDGAQADEGESDRLHSVRRSLPARLAWTWRFAVVGAVVGWTVLIRHNTKPDHRLSPTSVLVSGAVGAAVAAGAWVSLLLLYLLAVRRYGSRRQTVQSRRQESALEAWTARRSAFEEQESRRLASLPQWVSAPAPGHRRIDVVGGNLWGWEAFLTVFGASALAARGPTVVLDLSGEQITGELARG
ncbi:MAG: hypothetical protein HOV83_15185, partial [Catenulispora sp.]|nr:hypothetical protein [Catenulispora sp.]